jgi:prolyl oligopeptidase
MPGIDARPTLEAPDDDPYLWLEDIESPRVLDWVEAQNAAILQRFNDAGAIADRDVLKAIFHAPDNLQFPSRRAGKLFNPWRDAAHPVAMAVTTLDRYQTSSPTGMCSSMSMRCRKEGEDWAARRRLAATGAQAGDRAPVAWRPTRSCCASSIS